MVITLISIALVFFARDPRFIAIWIAAWLSCQITVGPSCSKPISCIRFLYPSTSHAQRYYSVNSAAAVESSVVVCLLEVKETAALFMITVRQP